MEISSSSPARAALACFPAYGGWLVVVVEVVVGLAAHMAWACCWECGAADQQTHTHTHTHAHTHSQTTQHRSLVGPQVSPSPGPMRPGRLASGAGCCDDWHTATAADGPGRDGAKR